MRPNILFLLSDQHAPSVAGFAGNEVVQTQHLDRLANESVVCETAICASPICTPSRMCLMTGKEAHHCSAWSNHWVIFPEHITWPGHFASHGYRTCLVGKMHFGGKDQYNGFQHRPYGDLRHGLGHQPDPIDMFPGYAHATSAGVTDIPESMTQDVVVARESLAFLLEHQDQYPDQPWFLCASFGRPHSPLTAPARYLRRYRDRVPLPDNLDEKLEPFAMRCGRRVALSHKQHKEALEAYYACVDFVDDCIGDLLQGLESRGLLENTIIVYTSDHGEMMGQHGLWGKQVYYDPSVRVPLLFSGPGICPGNHLVREPFSLVDLFPTTCQLADLPVPEGLDGVDQSALLASPDSGKIIREYAPSSFFAYGVKINHNRVDETEAHAAMRMIQSADWKFVEIDRGATLLFDLINDPDELRNLANDPAHQKRCSEMKAVLHRDFDWDKVREQIRIDRERVLEFASGQRPSTPNQYVLRDGRVCDAETGLYDVRWLAIPEEAKGGIIPQQLG